ncbi:Beta-ketoacyl synthase [Hirsutella rhossiliensis]|uniref:Beta-ketoacyl synthase n=1 Tax=Hirsutella rhossiliensis TaxID=111463 RepID=A0A9P8MPM4_9HYPO|nr:Beta-ketoacyl synthase [Hirsutella rhossiliensis]KAH0959983.1 Beta-ketoacyl synthase [Hirsutella rhossiliensis]
MGTTPSQDEPRPASSAPQHQRRSLLPQGVVELLVPPFKVAAGCGTAGVLAGVGAAVARDTNPYMSGFASGTQFFTLGYSYWFARTVAIRSWGGEEGMRPVDKITVSATAGSAAGAVAGLMRGPAKILPAMIFWGVLGAGGQSVVNHFGSKPKGTGDKEGWLRWIPLKKLTDDEYMDMMNEKLLRVEADIALIDERIAELAVAEKAEMRRQDVSTRKCTRL